MGKIEKILLFLVIVWLLFLGYKKITHKPSIFEQPAIPEPLIEGTTTQAR